MPQITITLDIPEHILERVFLDALTSTSEGKNALARALTALMASTSISSPEPNQSVLQTRIEELDLRVRGYNCLKKAGIFTVGDLIKKSETDLMNIRNFGRKDLSEVKDKLEALNLHLNYGFVEAGVDEEREYEDED